MIKEHIQGRIQDFPKVTWQGGWGGGGEWIAPWGCKINGACFQNVST